MCVRRPIGLEPASDPRGGSLRSRPRGPAVLPVPTRRRSGLRHEPSSSDLLDLGQFVLRWRLARSLTLCGMRRIRCIPVRSGGAEAAAVDEDVAGSEWKDGAGLPFSDSSRFQGAPMRNQNRGRLGRERVAEDAAYFEDCSARSRGTSAARGARRVCATSETRRVATRRHSRGAFVLSRLGEVRFRRASPLLPMRLGLLSEPEPFAELRHEVGHGATLRPFDRFANQRAARPCNSQKTRKTTWRAYGRGLAGSSSGAARGSSASGSRRWCWGWG